MRVLEWYCGDEKRGLSRRARRKNEIRENQPFGEIRKAARR